MPDALAWIAEPQKRDLPVFRVLRELVDLGRDLGGAPPLAAAAVET
jgi:hypothetical protein